MPSPIRLTHSTDAARCAPEGALPPTSTGSRPRLLFVDNLRVTLTVLVVLHHLAVTYSGLPLWYYVEPPPEDSWSAGLLSLFILINQSFFMGLFFLISGSFTPPSYGRKGARAFLLDRLARLGIPLLLFFVLLGPLSNLVLYRVEIVGKGVELPYWLFWLLTLGPGPLWFLEALLLFTVLYVAWRRLTTAPGEGIGQRAD
jgi:glucan biosynthesis protein C